MAQIITNNGICGFPRNSQEPCDDIATDDVIFTLPDGNKVIVPICDYHYYVVLTTPEWVIKNLYKEGKLRPKQ